MASVALILPEQLQTGHPAALTEAARGLLAVGGVDPGEALSFGEGVPTLRLPVPFPAHFGGGSALRTPVVVSIGEVSSVGCPRTQAFDAQLAIRGVVCGIHAMGPGL